MVSPAVDAMPREMKQRELALLRNPQLKYLPAYILKDTESFFAKYEKMAPEKRNEVLSGYKMLQDFVRRFVEAGGKIHSGSDPNHVVPGYAVHAELADAGRSRPHTAAGDSNREHQRRAGMGQRKRLWQRRERQSRGCGDRARRSAAKYFRYAKCRNGFYRRKKMDISFHADYKNPIPRPIEDRPES